MDKLRLSRGHYCVWYVIDVNAAWLFKVACLPRSVCFQISYVIIVSVPVSHFFRVLFTYVLRARPLLIYC